MLLEQAIFTSLKRRTQEGYQLAAVSSGMSAEAARELAAWGPAHDALLINESGASSLNFHQLATGDYCLSQTNAAGEEYSGRGGPRIYTQMVLVPPHVLARFANSPLSIADALTAAARWQIHDHPPEDLEPIELWGRASAVSPLRIAELLSDPGPDALAELLELATIHEAVAVASRQPLERLLRVLFMLLPVTFRPQLTFSTGLRYSPRRPFRLIALPSQPAEQRNIERASGARLLDLTSARDRTSTLESRWASLIRDLLSSGQFQALPQTLRRADELARQGLSLEETAGKVAV